jgi:hypothetical protein
MAMKFRAHDTFFIRKGWLSKGMKHVVAKPDVFVDKSENPTDILGIGANMVKALRYWLPVVGLTWESKKGKRIQGLTPLGELIYQYDRYIEELGTLYLLQYKFANQKEEAAAWYFFFNEFSMSEFTKEDFVLAIQNYIMMTKDESPVAIRSLSEDFTCIINTYLPRYKSNPAKVSPENNIDCPFGELGLVDILNKEKKTYKKSIPAAKSLNPWVAFAVILDQEKEKENKRDEIGLNELLTKPGNIGRVFNLDSITMLDVLHEIEKLGKIKIIRTAGLDVIHIYEQMTFEECVEKYYESIEKG